MHRAAPWRSPVFLRWIVGQDLLITLLIGCIVGLSSGLFGIGGALIATPLLNTILGMPPLLALATPLPVAIPSALTGTITYHRYGLIDFRSAKKVLIGALPANIAGVFATKLVGGTGLMVLTGVFLGYVGITFFIRGWLQREEPDRQERDKTGLLIATGAFAGFLSGLLAIGGGIVMVPAFIRFSHMKMKKALATSLFCVAILSIPSSVGHLWLEHIDLSYMFVLMISAVPLSYVGTRLAIAMRNKVLERAFGTFTIVFALYFLLRQML